MSLVPTAWRYQNLTAPQLTEEKSLFNQAQQNFYSQFGTDPLHWPTGFQTVGGGTEDVQDISTGANPALYQTKYGNRTLDITKPFGSYPENAFALQIPTAWKESSIWSNPATLGALGVVGSLGLGLGLGGVGIGPLSGVVGQGATPAAVGTAGAAGTASVSPNLLSLGPTTLPSTTGFEGSILSGLSSGGLSAGEIGLGAGAGGALGGTASVAPGLFSAASPISTGLSSGLSLGPLVGSPETLGTIGTLGSGLSPLEQSILSGLTQGPFTGSPETLGVLGSSLGFPSETSNLLPSLLQRGVTSGVSQGTKQLIGGSSETGTMPTLMTPGATTIGGGGQYLQDITGTTSNIDDLLKNLDLTKPAETGMLGFLQRNWPTASFLGGGLIADYLLSGKKAKTEEEAAKSVLDLINSGQTGYQEGLTRSYEQAKTDTSQAYQDYLKQYENVTEAAKPDIEKATKAIQGIVSGQMTAAQEQAAREASIRGTGGGAYGADLDRIRREGLETAARSMLPYYSGVNLPLPAMQPVVQEQIAPPAAIPSIDVLMAASGGSPNSDWIRNALGLGTQLASQNMLLDYYKSLLG